METQLTTKRLILIIAIGFILLLLLAFTDPGLAGAATPPPEWDRSSIQVDGQCLADGVARFTITNTGAAMTGPVPWRLFQDDQFIAEGTFQLLANSEEILEYGPYFNIPIRLEVDQRPGHPGSSSPQLTLTCAKTTAIGLCSFTATSAGNRGGCGRGNMITLSCNVSDAGPGFVSGNCEYGHFFSRVSTARTFRIGQIVTARGCEGLNGELYAPIRISR